MPANYAPGLYACEIESQALGYWKDDQTRPIIELAFRPLVDVDGQGMPLDVTTQRLTLWLTERAIDFTIAKLRVLGWHGEDIMELHADMPNAHSFAGQRINLVCGINEAGYNTWDFEMGPKKMKSAPIESFRAVSAKLRPRLKMTAAKPKPKVASPAEPSDIPF